jgi:AraC-like DNA-binding protein
METEQQQLRIDPLMARIVENMLSALGEEGARACRALSKAPVSEWRAREVVELVRYLRRTTADEFLGLGASPCAPGAYSYIIDLTTRCGTLRDAITMAFRFLALVTRAVEFRLIEESGQAIIEIVEPESPRDPQHILGDWSLIVWHKLSQWLIGAEIYLARTEIDHALNASYGAYTTMFGGDVVFNASASRLVFARSYLDRRVIRNEADAARLKETSPGYIARPLGLARTWKQRIRDILRDELIHGETLSTIEDLAAQLGVGSQTLRRRLKTEGSSYRLIKADARREVAVGVLLNRQDATLGEASAAAGFAEENALSRALKASDGISGTQFREHVSRWRS